MEVIFYGLLESSPSAYYPEVVGGWYFDYSLAALWLAHVNGRFLHEAEIPSETYQREILRINRKSTFPHDFIITPLDLIPETPMLHRSKGGN